MFKSKNKTKPKTKRKTFSATGVLFAIGFTFLLVRACGGSDTPDDDEQAKVCMERCGKNAGRLIAGECWCDYTLVRPAP
jgi:hypothetical protein